MTSSNPKLIEDKIYDRFSLNLAITGLIKPDGTEDANVAMRLVPTRVEDGVVEKVDGAAIPIYLGSIADVDPITQQVVFKIKEALQEFVTLKGL